MWPIVILVLVVLGVATALVVIGLRNPQDREVDLLQDRLEEFAQRGEQVNLEKIELSQPFTERVVYPLARRLGEFAIRFTPQNALQATAKKLELAGAGANLDPTLFLAMQFIVAAAFGGVMILVFSFAKIGWGLGVRLLIIAVFIIIRFLFSPVVDHQPYSAAAKGSSQGYAGCAGPADHLC